ncbi:MAG: hypothetical protein IK095_04360 [Oscillospiraceae bacterium]|nr:hypothetical protein [Oscillospiraceae bacterium]
MEHTTNTRTKRTCRSAALSAALALAMLLTLLSGCGSSPAAPTVDTPAQDAGNPAQTEPAASENGTAPETEPASQTGSGRQDGERFEDVIIMEGMEETVHYEHIRSESIGFEMDYDYESFVRQSDAGCERFVSCWDDPAHPENYLDLSYNAHDAATVAAAISEELSRDYEVHTEEAFTLQNAGSCIRIDASADVGGLTMPDQLQMAYIIPAADGCRVATAHYAIEASEGFGRRFHAMMDTFAVLAGQGARPIAAEQALTAVRRYCLSQDPGLQSILDAGDYPVYWEIEAAGEQEITILFRAYTGAQIRYHIDPISGETSVTELVPGVHDEEQPTDERRNIWDYAF